MDTIKFAFKWKILNFNSVLKVKNKAIGPAYPYTLPINEQICFQLGFLPLGDITSRKGYAAFVIYLIRFPKDNLLVNFKVSLLDQDEHKRFTKTDRIKFIFSRGTNTGWPDFILLETILNPKNKLLPNDTFTIYMELEMYECQLFTPDIFPSKMDIPNIWYEEMRRSFNLDVIPTESVIIPEGSVKLSKFAHIWSIDNFSTFLKVQNSSQEVYIDSRNFIFPLDKSIQFYLRLYPNGYNKESINHVDVLLSYLVHEDLPNVIINWKLYILDENFKKCNEQMKMVQLVLENGKSVRFPLIKYISHEALQNMRKSILPDDRLKFLCEIEAMFHPAIKTLPSIEIAKYKMKLVSKQLSSKNDFTESYTNANVKSEKCEHTWIIEDASKLRKPISEMVAVMSDKPNFNVTLNPNGLPGDDPDFVSIMCMLVGHKGVTFRTKISIIDVFGIKSNLKETQRKNDNAYEIHRTFINRRYLMDPTNGLLWDGDKFKIHFELTFITESKGFAPNETQSIVDKYLFGNLSKYYSKQTSITNVYTQVIRMFHKWTVKNFETYYTLKEHKFPLIDSRKFCSPVNDSFKYQLSLAADGLKRPFDNQQKYCLRIAPYVTSYGLARNSMMNHEFGLIDQLGRRLKSKERKLVMIQDFKTQDVGYIEQDILFDPVNKFFINGDLIIYSEIYIYDNYVEEIQQKDDLVVNEFDTPWNVLKQAESMSHSESQTELKILNCEHKWTISDFSNYGDKGCEEQSDSVENGPFSPDENDRLQFTLRVYPNGENTNDRTTVNIYLFLASFEKSEVIAHMKISILNKNGIKFNTKENSMKLSKGSNLDWPIYIKRDYLIENDLLLDDQLTIYCEIQSLLEPINHPVIYRDELIEKEMSNFLIHNQPSDIELTFVDNDKKLYAHKSILSARSKAFSAMFQHEMQEQITNQVEIVDVPLEVFEVLLRFMYTGKIVLNDIEMAIELFIASDKYGLVSLKLECDEWLCMHLTKETSPEILVLSDLHGADQLKAYALNYIRKHSSKIAKTEDFQKLCQTRPDLVDELNLDLENLNLIEQLEQNSDDEDISVL